MELAVGAVVIDWPTNSVATVAFRVRVPRCADLFGQPVPGHYRYVLRFPDSTWADDRRDDDFELLDPGGV